MLIKNDYSYIDAQGNTLIEQGYAELGVHSLKFNRHYSDEEERQNRETAESMSEDAWESYCDEVSKPLYQKLLSIAEMLDDKYNMYQFPSKKSATIPYRSDWDLFFYSNKGWNSKDYFTYMQISFNKGRNAAENLALKDEIIALLEKIEVENVACRVQYMATIDYNKIASKAREVFEQHRGKFVTHSGMVGRLEKVNDDYAFFKKGAYRNYYPLTPTNLVFMKAVE